MATQRHYRPFTTKELERIKQMYLAGSSLTDMAEALKRTQSSISALLTRLIHHDKVLVIRSTPLIALGGLESAEEAVRKAKEKGAKNVRYLTKNCAYSNVPVTDLEQHISRYKFASHLFGVNA